MALWFDVSEYLTWGSMAAYQITGDVSYACRVKPSALPASNSEDWIFMCGESTESEADNIIYSIGIRNTSGSYYWRVFWENGAGSNNLVDFAYSIATGTEYSLVVVRDTAAKTIELFVDGVSLGTQSYANNPTGGSNTRIRVAASWVSGQEYSGEVGEVIVWNRKLTSVEAASYHTIAFPRELADDAVVFYSPLGGQPVGEVDLISGRFASISGTPTNVSVMTQIAASPDLAPNASQGYAKDSTYNYTSATTSLHKYDSGWALVTSNTSPFGDMWGLVDHIGDITVDGSFLYAGVGKWVGCDNTGSRWIARYNTSDLSLDAATKIPDSAFVAAVAVDPITDELIGIDYCGHTMLAVYDKATLGFKRFEELAPSPFAHGQGAACKDGLVYVHYTDGILGVFDRWKKRPIWYNPLPITMTEGEGLYFDGATLKVLAHNGAAQNVYDITGVPQRSAESITVSITLDGQANLSGLEYMWFDESKPSLTSKPVVTGNDGVVDSNGVFTLDLTGRTGLSSGDTGFLVLSDTDGQETTNHHAFAGPVVVT